MELNEMQAWLDNAPEGIVAVQVDLPDGTTQTFVLKED